MDFPNLRQVEELLEDDSFDQERLSLLTSNGVAPVDREGTDISSGEQSTP